MPNLHTWPMSENLDLVRSILADWERGDFSSAEWAHGDVECVFAGGPDPSGWSGLTGMAEGMRAWLSAWNDFRVEATEYRELDQERHCTIGDISLSTPLTSASSAKRTRVPPSVGASS